MASRIIDISEDGREVRPLIPVTKYYCPNDKTEVHLGHVDCLVCPTCFSTWDGRYPERPGRNWQTSFS